MSSTSLASSGEDDIAFSTESDYAANIEMAEAIACVGKRAAATQELKTVDTPNQKTIAEVSAFLGTDSEPISESTLGSRYCRLKRGKVGQ